MWNLILINLTETSKFRELWSPARQQIWPWSRSKVTVNVTAWYHWKGLVTKNTHAKCQSSICNSAKVMAKVKVFVTDRRTDGQTDEWDLMSPRFRESGGQKKEAYYVKVPRILIFGINFPFIPPVEFSEIFQFFFCFSTFHRLVTICANIHTYHSVLT